MTQALQIDFISDIACPWCAIGLSSLQRALANLGDSVEARMTVHPFELNPDMGPDGESIVEYLGKKYGRTPEQIAETQEAIRERGESVGFTFGPRTRIYNTFDAHRLLYWARLEGRQVSLKMALLRAYHGEGQDMSDHAVLVAVAQSVGLDAGKAREVLETGAYADEVRGEEQQAQAMGIQSVPAIVFNEQYLISGGQPVETFENAIRQILAEAAKEA
ncbi:MULTISPECIES: DsbA family oxidoreductase [Paraburkholderia]|uniref:DsbA family dithiol-disulfide isomerase n=1 Tax=Paraburkholderia tropica TaxID=92647 RepID=A0ABX5MUN8_9BURK|nr:DsbA family oxidoreductase [Paraburkholderia tropica]MBB2980635.1 putative DsbA family dithiol-disulfide isomerase [Paraburkholderia tropica]MBB3003305.1 putative DsbA family dithiol-disulfide isomerase [Paraburkholderia tropica]MBB6322321.1 putative DsbA family dithiol-disulfide isomerase [Paraburkholderia tropica]MDE1140007.1 DsbA family oxidoreductase [Paraburkholderia tropica]OBR48255.1 disulfide bond formation protein DsbA [Paraburkholderia tropica]